MTTTPPDRGPDPSRKADFLEEHGMSKDAQFGAEMRAAAVPASDFEGEYAPMEGYTYNPNSHLSRVLWESRMRREMKSKDD